MDKKNIMAVLCEPGKQARIVALENSLKAFQNCVGGPIEVTCPYELSAAVVCNAFGKVLGLPVNRALRDNNRNVQDIMAGTFLVVGLDENGGFESLSSVLLEKYRRVFQYPEQAVFVEDKILMIPVRV